MTAKEIAESVPTVVISLAFCSNTKETLETADSRGEAILKSEGLIFFRENKGGFYTWFLAATGRNVWGTSRTWTPIAVASK